VCAVRRRHAALHSFALKFRDTSTDRQMSRLHAWTVSFFKKNITDRSILQGLCFLFRQKLGQSDSARTFNYMLFSKFQNENTCLFLCINELR
jgi:hypothetical protein